MVQAPEQRLAMPAPTGDAGGRTSLAPCAGLPREKRLAYYKQAHYIDAMTSPALDRSFGFVLHDIARLMRKRYEQRARSLGVTRAQWQVLAHLQRHEGINQSGLAELLELEPITLARLVDRMEQAGLVERRLDPADRRARRLYLTARAAPLLEQSRQVGDAVRAEAFAGLAEEERARLLELLLRVRGNLSERRGDEAATAPAKREPVETIQ
jgi:MarR family transcriptional regulator, transcriptional regulator for hemolysin